MSGMADCPALFSFTSRTGNAGRGYSFSFIARPVSTHRPLVSLTRTRELVLGPRLALVLSVQAASKGAATSRVLCFPAAAPPCRLR